MNGPGKLPSVAIVGRPNVGKSAVFNWLIGRSIAIVHDQPGITRDRLSAVCTRGARPFLLWDTGGVGGELELSARVRRAVEEAIEQSDVLLFVVDAKHGLSPMDQDLARALRKSRKPIVLAINKIDDPKHENLANDFASLGFEDSAPISAAHRRGISKLLEQLDKSLPENIAEHGSKKEDQIATAIVGRPNVGKSSLINAIVRAERAIVSELPGTTRDAVDILYHRGDDHFRFIDTAGIRKRSKHSTSVEVFSVMRSEKSIRRAAICVLVIDVTAGVTAQDKKIASLIQQARKPAIVVVNKFDLMGGQRGANVKDTVSAVRERLFFSQYAPVLVTSALTGKDVDKIFRLIARVRKAAQARIGTGVLNRVLRAAFAANPPPMISGRRLKLFYATQAGGNADRDLQPPEFVLFVNEPRLLSETYRRYLESRIREVESYEGLPIILSSRPRTETRKK